MKERPIIFSGPMVRAILEERKTQTRRPVRPQPMIGASLSEESLRNGQPKRRGRYEYWGIGPDDDPAVEINMRPYAFPGDRLWVRENFQRCLCAACLRYWPRETIHPVTYTAGNPNFPNGCIVRPSIYMPRWASRITLEVLRIRVERVQEITTCNIGAEGINLENNHDGARNEFRSLWDSINAKRGYGWDVNPWVWVIEFQRVK